MKCVRLEGEWTLSRIDGEGIALSVPFAVPGSLAGTLIRAGMLPDPLEKDWRAQARAAMRGTWEVSREFSLDEKTLVADFADLSVSAVVPEAAVLINGKKAMSADNPSGIRTADVRDLLQRGINRICFRFSGADAEDAFPKAGLRGEVSLALWSRAKISDMGIGRSFSGDGAASLHIGGWIESDGESSVSPVLDLALFDPEGRLAWSGKAEIPPGGDGAFNATVLISDPQLWWPSGMGGQPLYTLRATLSDASDGTILDQRDAKVALRTLSAQRNADGSSAMTCNGRPFFLRGAVWTPPHPFEPLVTRADFQQWLSAASEANFNALLLPQGAMPEAEPFWEMCDETGLVVLGTAALAERASAAGENASAPAFMRHACVPDVPLGEPGEETGLDVVRSVISWPSAEAIAAALPNPADRNLTGPEMAKRVGIPGGPSALLAALTRSWPIPEKAEDWPLLSQFAQAREVSLRTVRARLEKRSSGLVWSPFVSSDAVADASSIDAAGNWKILQFEAARAFAPQILVPPQETGGAATFINESGERAELVFKWRFSLMNGRVIEEGSQPFAAEPFSSTPLQVPSPERYLRQFGAGNVVLWLKAEDDGGEIIARAHRLYAPPNALHLQDPQIEIDPWNAIEEDGVCVYTTFLTAAAPAFCVHFQSRLQDAIFGDAGFALEPGESVAAYVSFPRRVRATSLDRVLRVRSLFDMLRG